VKKQLAVKEYSGIYPQLAVTNQCNGECGIGAVVAWAGKLWYLTYPPHMHRGSDDKLYSLDDRMQVTVHPESVGGTHANRMIHRESNQLIIGPYFISDNGLVRAISPDSMPGRLTAVARHLTNPSAKVYFYTMESGLYEVDVHSLEVRTLHEDLNSRKKQYFAGQGKLLPGVHGKGAYTGQGRLVVSNNGYGGVLAEWNGEQDASNPASWNIVDPNKYTEVTGPGGIYGSADGDSPLWAVGWDAKSVLLRLCDRGQWSRFRLPKGSFTHEADQGWYTEWPRIRDIGQKWLLMDMFGTFFQFPRSFAISSTAGIRPISRHHKMTVDISKWNDQLVMACNDASMFENKPLGRPQSNLWFTTPEQLNDLGRPAGWGGVWVRESVNANEPSEPFLLAGFEYRVLHLSHDNAVPVTFTLEIDEQGTGVWTELAAVTVGEKGYAHYSFSPAEFGEWVRVKADQDIASATAYFQYSSSMRTDSDRVLFRSLAAVKDMAARSEGTIRPGDDGNLTLQFAAQILDRSGQVAETAYYEMDASMQLVRTENPQADHRLRTEFATRKDFETDEASVIIVDQHGNRYRLPKGASAFDAPSPAGWPRGIREVVTERNLMNVHGTFYELPRDNSGGVARIQPVCSHEHRVFDFMSWRGMLVLSGNVNGIPADGHYIPTDDGKAGLWFGNVDDLWKLGAPKGTGGPWNNTEIQAEVPSDPYLMTGYGRKTVEFTHDHADNVRFTLEVDVLADGTWCVYDTFSVPANRSVRHEFPQGYSAHWVRVRADQHCRATAWFIYD
jgi:hypothetical protein